MSCSAGQAISLTAQGGMVYEWQGPNNFVSHHRDTVIANADLLYSGDYQVIITNENYCLDTVFVNVTVHPSPVASVISNSPLCEAATLVMSADGGATYAVVRT